MYFLYEQGCKNYNCLSFPPSVEELSAREDKQAHEGATLPFKIEGPCETFLPQAPVSLPVALSEENLVGKFSCLFLQLLGNE